MSYFYKCKRFSLVYILVMNKINQLAYCGQTREAKKNETKNK